MAIELTDGLVQAKRLIEAYALGLTRIPLEVEITKDTEDPAYPRQEVTVFSIRVPERRAAALLIGMGGVNIETLRALVVIMASKREFFPVRVNIIDPMSEAVIAMKKAELQKITKQSHQEIPA